MLTHDTVLPDRELMAQIEQAEAHLHATHRRLLEKQADCADARKALRRAEEDHAEAGRKLETLRLRQLREEGHLVPHA